MRWNLKTNSLIVCGLVALLWWVFEFAKHARALAGVVPFGDDPYDAVGSYAVMAAGGLAVIALLRAFRPYRDEGRPSRRDEMYLIRTQIAVCFVMLVNLASDGVALLRHPELWLHARSRALLLTLLLGSGCMALTVLWLVRCSQERRVSTLALLQSRGFLALVAGMIFLGVYPEHWIHIMWVHLATVLLGAVIVCLPVGWLVESLVPDVGDQDEAADHGWLRRYAWPLALLAGLTFGVMAFVSEATESGGGARVQHASSLVKVMMVASVFIALGAGGLLIAYRLLRKPLGLGA
ncbi:MULTISPECIES: hypothetical protein [Acidobacterium]|uniref:Putative membrane protein n=1 Tax=Acidobacterium capsulatum (strain ATCC 51196 / DSM 11244 / BCRC 80197 / JCM 7670 / NBRC 15755 / NCIMB 13165 / 161) TaxID=240015 RepID=C1F8C9_ACIC5|nr:MULTISPECIES: hypothetical protein [Acidobacterium]ACO32377.1 putative membrane protein [Acidobacterium capsulatum ATCC 51196]HCT59812.1 hypothetical protein [Acidobacterium sp.]